jgi:hypothetical protein
MALDLYDWAEQRWVEDATMMDYWYGGNAEPGAEQIDPLEAPA